MKDRQSLRTAYGKTLLKLGLANPEIVVLDADLAKSTQTQLFGKQIAERFIDMGLAEQDMISTAAGIALTGKTVFASSFCVFLVGRVFDQIRQSVCYNKANVKLVGSHSGLGVGEDGATHQALEDIALMRTLPGMRIMVPADAIQTAQMIEYAAANAGPFFIRLTRSNLPLVYDDSYRFEFGQTSILRDGRHLAILAIGAMVEKALQAADILAGAGITAAVLNPATIKPLDGKTLLAYAQHTGRILTVEDHSVFGGLGGAVSEFLAQHQPVKMKIMGVNDQFGRSGAPEELYRYFHLSAEDIVQQGKSLLASP